jgi:molybdopterin-guanine dinucleotide biosynthesis protein A
MLPDRLLFVVLAGNDTDSSLLGGVGQPSKFLMQFGDELTGDRIVRALDGSRHCRAIAIALPPADCETYRPRTRHPIVLAPHGPTRLASMHSALERAGTEGLYSADEYVLVVTGDLPLLTPEAIDHFCHECGEHPEADCYMGMVPLCDIDPGLHPLVTREGLVFRGQSCLHTDIYLFRPSAMSPTAQRRFDGIMAIRRTGRTSIRGFARALRLVLEIVGMNGLRPFMRVVLSIPSVTAQPQPDVAPGPDRLERSVLELIEKGFGLRLCLVPIDEPMLALGFDYRDDLKLLSDYHGTRAHQATVQRT